MTAAHDLSALREAHCRSEPETGRDGQGRGTVRRPAHDAVGNEHEKAALTRCGRREKRWCANAGDGRGSNETGR